MSSSQVLQERTTTVECLILNLVRLDIFRLFELRLLKRQTEWRIEKYLEASGLDYTMLRPVAFFDNLPKRSALTTFAFLGVSSS